MTILPIKTSKRIDLIDITPEIDKIVHKSGVKNGLCVLYCPHTTAGITINEGADPDVKEDILRQLEEIAPESKKYRHMEGNADSHIKSSIVGCSQTVPIEGNRLFLGHWQSVFFAEFDGPRTRRISINIIPSV